mgnify:CR=1 FL=1|tara:strand:- start:633 stop:905 length:273 start_codon:yes stop_codon:yes gene_type:complete
MDPSKIKNMMSSFGINPSMQQQQLVSHWKDMSASVNNSKKRRRPTDAGQGSGAKITKTQCRTRVQTEGAAQKDATDFGVCETREMPSENH